MTVGILEQFGIEGKLLIVQLINFAVLAFVMMKFVYPRIAGMLEERKNGIETALQQAEQARKETEKARADHDAAQKKAKAEAAQILKEARETAAAQGAEMVAAARTEAQKLTETTKAQLRAEKDALRDELRTELADLTIATTRKVLSQVVTEEDTKKMVQAAGVHLGKERQHDE